MIPFRSLFITPIVAALLVLVAAPWAQGEDAAVPPAGETVTGFPKEQIEQLVAPVALYPDALLAQILMASTYPLDIVRAARWIEDNEELEGEALQAAVDEEPWDASIRALAFLPGVLAYMNENLDWSQDLGEAFLGQEDEVMDAIQGLRRLAQEAGTLESNDKQQVQTDGDVIVVQPADPQVIYVPTYTPATAYGTQDASQTPYYATYTQPTPVVYDDAQDASDNSNLVSFGVGALVGGLLTAAILWDNNDDDYRGVYWAGPGYYGRPGYWGRPGYNWRRPVNVDRNVDIDIDRSRKIEMGDIDIDKRVGKWEFSPEHRGKVEFRNERTRKELAGTIERGPVDPGAARGFIEDARGGDQRPSLGEIEGRLKQPDARPERPTSLPTERIKPQIPRDGKRQDVQLRRPEKLSRPSTRPEPAAAKSRAGGVSRKRSEGAFRVGNAKLERAASNRGAKSRSRKARSSGGGKGGRLRERRG